MFKKNKEITFVEFFLIALFVLLFSMLLLFFAEKAFATTYTQIDETTTFTDTTYPGIRLGKGFSGPLNEIKLRASATSCIRYFYYVRGYSDSGYSNLVQTITGYPDEWNSVTTPDEENWGNEVKSFTYGDVTLHFNGETLDPDNYYQIWGNSDCGDSSRSMGFKGKTGAGADEGWRTDDQSWQMGQIPYYIINPSTTIPSSIAITFPSDGSTATSSPGYHSYGTYTLGETEFLIPPRVRIQLQYHQVASSTDYSTLIDSFSFVADTSTTTAQNWDRALPLNLPNVSTTTNNYFRVEATIYDPIYTSIIYASSTSDFYVDIPDNTEALWPIPADSGSSTSTGEVLRSCNSDDINTFQKVLCWVFVPSYTSLNQFTGLFDRIKNKAPLGYFYRIKDALNDLSSTSSAFEWNVASSSIPVFGQFRSGMSWFFWLIFAFWVFNRFRHFEL